MSEEEKESQSVRRRATATGQPYDLARENESTPREEKLPDGQHIDHWVLSEEERQGGFVRPVRRTYKHVGTRPTHPLRDLTEEEKERYKAHDYVKFEEYSEGSVTGRFWTSKQLRSGCGKTTTMGLAIAETYAKAPEYYGATFCCTCGEYFRVGADGEFVWEGTDERVGT
jgi:hypothetical protein